MCTSKKSGVRFKDSDYAGFWVRMTILVLDILVVGVILAVSILLDYYIYESATEESFGSVSLLGALFAIIYLTIIKASETGTLGQMVTKTRVLNLRGEKPGFLRMLFRLCFWVLGPINFVADFAFLTLIKEKRTLRDCYCDTIVVKKGTFPVEEHIEIKVSRICAFGFNVMYRSAYSADA